MKKYILLGMLFATPVFAQSEELPNTRRFTEQKPLISNKIKPLPPIKEDFQEKEELRKSSHHQLGVSASTFGFGVYYKYGFGSNNFWLSRMELKASYDHFGQTEQDMVLGDNTTFEMDELTYTVGLESDVAGLAVDFYPFKRGSVFHLSFGAYNTKYLFKTHAWIKDSHAFEVGDETLTVNGRVDAYGDIEWDSPIAPYLGIGFDATLFAGITLGLDLGVLYTGSPDIDLRYSGTVDNGGTQVDISTMIDEADIRAQTKEIEEDLMAIEFLPMVKLSLGIRF